MVIRTADEALQAGTPDLRDLEAIKNRGTQQHESYLSALNSRRQQQPQGQAQMQGGGGSANGDLQGYARQRLQQLGY